MTSPKENAPVLAGTQGAYQSRLAYFTGCVQIRQYDTLRSSILSLRRGGGFASVASGRQARRMAKRAEQRRQRAVRKAGGDR